MGLRGIPFGLRPLSAALLAVQVLYCSSSSAAPQGASVAAGQVSISQPSAGVTQINASNGAIINWKQFSIGPGEITRFVQPSSTSAVLNRVVGREASQILGQLQANGRVFLINPNGIVIGGGARINTNSFIASTLEMADADFLAGKLKFTATPASGSINNQGVITAGPGGSVALIAPNIENSGVIQTPDGKLLLAAGRKLEIASLDLDGVTFEIQAPTDSVLNLGQLLADNGAVQVFAGMLRQSGEIRASRLVEEADGSVRLVASHELTLTSDSKINADGLRGGTIEIRSPEGVARVAGEVSAKGAEGKGGSIAVLGDKVAIESGARVDASGATGGGQILVGGDYQGKNADVQNASRVFVGAGAELRADATDRGNGGRIILWSDQNTRYQGDIFARGGRLGGDGGFAEVSGKQYLEFAGGADLSAAAGRQGTLLLDPLDIIVATTGGILTTVVDQFADFPTNIITISPAALNAVGGNVVLQAERNIYFNNAVALTAGGAGLTATAGGPTFNAGQIVLTQGISTNGGAVTLKGSAITGTGGITTAGGAVNLQTSGALSYSGAVNAGSGSITATGQSGVSNGNYTSTGSITLNATAGGISYNILHGGTLSLNASSSIYEPSNYLTASTRVDAQSTGSYVQLQNSTGQPLRLGTINGSSGVYLYSDAGMQQVAGGLITAPSVYLYGQNAAYSLGSAGSPLAVASPRLRLQSLSAPAHVAFSGAPSLTELYLQGTLAGVSGTTLTGMANLTTYTLSAGAGVLNGNLISSSGFGNGFTINVSDAAINIPTLTMPGAPVSLTAGGGGVTLGTTSSGSLTVSAKGPISATSLTTTAGNVYLNANKCTYYYVLCTDNSPITVGTISSSGSTSLYNYDNGNIDITSLTSGGSVSAQAGSYYYSYVDYNYHRTSNAINIGNASGTSISLSNSGTGNITVTGNLSATSSSLSVNAQVGAVSAAGANTSGSSSSFTAGNGTLTLGTVSTTNGSVTGSATGDLTFQSIAANGSTTRDVTLTSSAGGIRATADDTASDISATRNVTLSASSSIGNAAFAHPLDILAGATGAVSITSTTGSIGALGKAVTVDTNGSVTASAGGQFHIAVQDTSAVAKTLQSIDLSASASGMGSGGASVFTSQDLSVNAASNGSTITIGDIVQSANTLDKFRFNATGTSGLTFGNVNLTTTGQAGHTGYAGYNQLMLASGGALTQSTGNINAGYISLTAGSGGAVNVGNVTASTDTGNSINISGGDITAGNLNAPAITLNGANLTLGTVATTGTHRGYYSGYDYVPRLGYYQYVSDELHLTASGSLIASGNISSATSAFVTSSNGISAGGGAGTITGGHTSTYYYNDTVNAAAGAGVLDTGAISALIVNASGNSLNTGNLTADLGLTISGTNFSTGDLTAGSYSTLALTAATGYTAGAIALSAGTINMQATAGGINLNGATSVTAPNVTLNASAGAILANNLTGTTSLNVTAGSSFVIASTGALTTANVTAKGDQLGTSSITGSGQTFNYSTTGASTAGLSLNSGSSVSTQYTERIPGVTDIDISSMLGGGSSLYVSGLNANLTASSVTLTNGTAQLTSAGNINLTSASTGSGWVSATSTGGDVTLTSVTTNNGSVTASAAHNINVDSVTTTGANVNLAAGTGSILKTGSSAVQIDTANGAGNSSGSVSLSAANGTVGSAGTPIKVSKTLGLSVTAKNDIAIDMNNTTLTDLRITTGASGSGLVSIVNNPTYAGFSLTRVGSTELLLGPISASGSDFRLYATNGDIRVGGDISVYTLYLNAQGASNDLIIAAAGGPRALTAPYQSDLRAGRDVIVQAGALTGENVSVQTGYSNVVAGRDIKVLADGGSALLAVTAATTQTLSAGRDIRIVGGSQGIAGASAAVTTGGGQNLYARQSDGSGSLLIQAGSADGASASASGQSGYSQNVVANNVSILGGSGNAASAAMTGGSLDMVNTYGGVTVQAGSGANAYAEINTSGSQSIGNQNNYYYNPTDFILVQGGTNAGTLASIRATGSQYLYAVGDIRVLGGSGSGSNAEIYSSGGSQTIGSTGTYYSAATQNVLVQAGGGGTARIQAAGSQSIMAGGDISVLGGTGANMTAAIESTGSSQNIGYTYIYSNDPTNNLLVQGGTASGAAAWLKAATGQSIDAGQNITLTAGTTGAYAEVSTTAGSQSVGNLNGSSYDQTNLITLTGGNGNNAHATLSTGGSQTVRSAGAISLAGGTGNFAGAVMESATGQSVTTSGTLTLTGGTASVLESSTTAIRNITSGTQTLTAGGAISLTGGGYGSDTLIEEGGTGTQTITAPSLAIVAAAAGGPVSTTGVISGGNQNLTLNGGAGNATLTVVNYSSAAGGSARLYATGNQSIVMPFALAGSMQVGATTALGESLVYAGGTQDLIVGDLLVQGGQTAPASAKLQVVGDMTVNSLAGPIQVLGGAAGPASIDPPNLNVISNTGVNVVGGGSSTATATILAGNINIGATNGNVLVTGGSAAGASAGITATGFLNVFGSGNMLITPNAGGAGLTAGSSSTITLNGFCTGCTTGLFGPFNVLTGSSLPSLIPGLAPTQDQLLADLFALLDSLGVSLEADLFASTDEDPFLRKKTQQCS